MHGSRSEGYVTLLDLPVSEDCESDRNDKDLVILLLAGVPRVLDMDASPCPCAGPADFELFWLERISSSVFTAVDDVVDDNMGS